MILQTDPGKRSARRRLIAGVTGGFVLAIVLLTGTLWVVRQSLEVSVVDATQSANASMTQAFINENWSRVRDLLPAGEGWSPAAVRASRENAEIDERVRAFSKGTDVLKIKIYNLAGRVLYSSDPVQIGDDASANRYFRAALVGTPGSQLTFRGRFDAMEGHVFDRDLIASYIPVRYEGRVEGVVELYADRTFAVAQFHEALATLSVILSLVYLGLYGVIVALLLRQQRLRDQKESELREAAAREERANRAKTEFLTHMSHELRTPLNVILGHAQLMEGEFAAAAASAGGRVAAREHAERIMAAGWHLLGLIEDVLDLTKIESGAMSVELAPVDLPGLLAQCLAQVEGMAALARVRLCALQAEDAATWASADALKLRQVLLNLLSNAIKYNVPGGAVEVFARRVYGAVRIEVRDEGRGMSTEQLERLFQPFTRFVGPGEVIQGSGVGLALSQRLVEAMNGTLAATSEAGKGSVFTVSLEAAEPPAAPAGESVSPPAKPPAMPDPPPEAAPAAAPPGLPLRVLYIEDTATNLEIVRLYLARHGGCEFFGAEDGERGLEVAQREQPDVILLDLNLPGIDGRAVKAQLAQDPRTARIPVIALSAGALSTDIERALEAGFLDYLTKPLRLQRLAEVLDRVRAARG